MSADERGSIISLTDSSGTLLNINRYDEYGTPQSTNTGRFQYTGQVWLGEIGMQYSKARIYSPTLGRFLQTDPIGYDGGVNLYAYVVNDPVNFDDPLGLDSAQPQFTYCGSGCTYGADGGPIIPGHRGDGVHVLPIRWTSREGSSTQGDSPSGGGGGGSGTEYVPGTPRSSNLPLGCLSNIDADAAINLGLDAVGVVASLTGLKAAYEAGSAAVGATAGILALTSAALSGSNEEAGVAGIGAVAGIAGSIAPHALAGTVAKKVLTSIPVAGVIASGGILAYDAVVALHKARCF